MIKNNLDSYKIRLSGNVQNILLVGAIYYVKKRRVLRFVVTVIGITFLALGIFATFTFVFAGQRTLLLTAGFFLLFISVLAGEQFKSAFLTKYIFKI